MNGADSRSLNDRVGPDRGWLAMQFALFGLTALAGPAGRWLAGRLPVPWPVAVDIGAGVLLILVAWVIVIKAANDLGESLRAAPTPIEGAKLVDSGWYGRVRHPMYLAVFVGMAGWSAVWMSWLVIVVVAASIVFFNLKARFEERKLLEAYPGYGDYMDRVKARFLPRVL